MINSYYQDELRYLREVGPEFSKAHPTIARYLADPGSDPDIERLLEGVAFLTGRIRQKLDDELPEFTANLMALLWPHYLRPVPSVSILEFLPHMEAMQAPVSIPGGAEFASIPVEGTRCRFQSCWPCIVRPWLVEEARLETAAAHPVRLVLRLRTAPKAALDKLDLDRVQFYLTDLKDPRTAFSLYFLLCAHLASITISDGSSTSERQEETLPTSSVRPSAIHHSHAMIPYPPHSFSGYRLLQEYFTLKHRFLFIDLFGLKGPIARMRLSNVLELTFTFDRRLEVLPNVTKDNVRLHCVPIINLFQHSADPIRLTHDRVQYLVQPSKSGLADRRHAEVYSIQRVHGVIRTSEFNVKEYLPFYSFAHMRNSDPRTASYYQSHIVPNVVDGDLGNGTDTYLSVVLGNDQQRQAIDETLSLELLCTNRNLAQRLRSGDISEPTDSSPAGIPFRNIGKPTANYSPPLGKSLHWRLISHMSLNYISLANKDNFQQLLHLYNFTAQHDAQQASAHNLLISGIVSLRSHYHERIMRGAPVRGVRIDLELNEDNFSGEGDAYLFATILDNFFGLYVTINGFTELSVRMSRSRQEYCFAPRWGEQLTPERER